MDDTCEPIPLGLSSEAALSQLHAQLSSILQQHLESWKRDQRWRVAWSRSFLHHSVRWSSLHWPGALLTVFCASSLLTCHVIEENSSDSSTLIGGCVLLLLLLAGMVSMTILQRHRRLEMPRRVELLLSALQEFLQHPPSDWLKGTEDLFVPSSPAVSLQWTYRDGRLLNLPVALLVEGDIISLRPGNEAPTELRGVQEEEHVVLSRSDVFSHLSSPPSPVDSERSRPHCLLQPQRFRVTRTPAVEVVQKCLELSQQRPVSVLDNERFTVQSLLERGPALLILVLLLILNLLRYFLGAPGTGPWHVTLLQQPANGFLPLLPLTFPWLWFLVGMYGEVCVLLQTEPRPTHWWEVWTLTWGRFLSVLRCRSTALCYTASLLHNLGSVTVLCCVDKQGVLSWPSPNPEKILFFSRRSSSRRSDGDQEENSFKNWSQTCSRYGTEVLSLSTGGTQFDNTLVQFDDAQWQRHDASLRPLGLAVQLLLAAPETASRALRLTDHLTYAALLRTRPPCQPVRPPWGLAQLPGILGFSPFAHKHFLPKTCVAAYTLPTIPCSGELGSVAPPPVSMRRLPFSHLIALSVRHTHTDELHLFSYGSADVILGTCTEFWDGEEVRTLTDSDRKKVVDFYQRSCMAGQCVAVAFKPLLQTHVAELDGTCVELPPARGGQDSEELSPLGQQVFLGLVSAQFQARPDVVRLISGLDSACIRFVYFSNEEEVRSKVFAEKMGLETGWNCHISLQSQHFPLEHTTTIDREEEDKFLLGGLEVEVESRTTEHEEMCLTEDLNRAKLPKGIENVRPHLEQIDNVPLLVPLFTDCTSHTECEMVCIMQEYGEVVCCLGSSQNIKNVDIFLRSDISVGLEPLTPACRRSGSDDTRGPPYGYSFVSLTQLASAICGLPCTVGLGCQDNDAIIKLIRQARHTTAGIRKCFLFLLQCQLSLVIIQIVACVCQLPPPLATSDVLYLCCFYFPLLSVSLLGKPSDSSIMKVPTGKNRKVLPRKTLRFFMLCFVVKFGLTVCVLLTCFGLVLHGFCLKINHQDERLCHPSRLLQNSTISSPDWFGKHSDGLSLAQKVVAFFVLIYASFTSVSQVHRSAPVWKQSPLSNHSWCLVICTAPVLNVFFAMVPRLFCCDSALFLRFDISDVAVEVWLLGVLWLLPLICINEGIKLHEIRTRVRYQKRQKLQFDTKLGMNSPF